MARPITIQIKKLAADVQLPVKMTPHAAGFDLHAAVSAPVELKHGEIRVIPCGFAMAIPHGYEAQVRPRSGLASKFGITLINSPGTIDSDYRGEVKVILANLGEVPFDVVRGERIAQLVPAPVQRAVFREADDLDETARGGGGFGSTGR